MSNPKNTAGIVATIGTEPEIFEASGSRKLSFRAAINNSCRNSINPEDTTSWVTVQMWDNDRDSKWVFEQVTAGKMKKGSTVMIAYAFGTEKFKAKDDSIGEKVVFNAHGITYFGQAAREEGGEGAPTAEATGKQATAGSGAPDRF